MVKLSINKIYLLVGLISIGHAGPLLSEDADVPVLKQWIKEHKQNQESALINNLMVVKGWKGKSTPALANYNEDSIEIEGMMTVLSQKHLNFAYSLNRFRRKEISKKSFSERLNTASLIGSSTDIIVNTKKQWKYYRGEKGNLKKIFSAAKPSTMDAKQVRSWFSTNLGYQAVILDQKGDFFLVSNMTGNFATKDLQALILANSSEKFRMKNQGDAGVGLLKLENYHKTYGIFRTIFLEDESAKVPVGSKLILEKSGK